MKLVINKANFVSAAQGYPSCIDTFTGINICQTSEHSPVSKWRRTANGKTKERLMLVYTLSSSEESIFSTMIKQDLQIMCHAMKKQKQNPAGALALAYTSELAGGLGGLYGHIVSQKMETLQRQRNG